MKKTKIKTVKVFKLLPVPKIIAYTLMATASVLISNIFGYWWRYYGHYFITNKCSEKDNLMLLTEIALVGIVYAIFATRTIDSAWRRLEITEECCQKKDKEKFFFIYNISIHRMNHFCIACVSLLVLKQIASYSFDNFENEVSAVKDWSLIVTFLLVVANELDNKTSGMWFDIPEGWIEGAKAQKNEIKN